jgi:hypothetical protein
MAAPSNSASRGSSTERGGSFRELTAPITQRPWGILPPEAMAATTRAILNGDITTGPCPIAANGSIFASSPFASTGSSSRRAVSASAFEPVSTPSCAK